MANDCIMAKVQKEEGCFEVKKSAGELVKVKEASALRNHCFLVSGFIASHSLGRVTVPSLGSMSGLGRNP